MALTDIQIKNLKYSGKPMKLADGGGLYIYLTASGKKLWRFRYQRPGSSSRTNLSLG